MAFSLSQLQALDNAISSGELSIEYDGKKVTYRSVPELISARNIVMTGLQRDGLIGRQKRASLVVRGRD